MKWIALAILATACGPLNCQQFDIDIYAHPQKPAPAGKLVMKCDGRKVVEALADNVQAGGK